MNPAKVEMSRKDSDRVTQVFDSLGISQSLAREAAIEQAQGKVRALTMGSCVTKALRKVMKTCLKLLKFQTSALYVRLHQQCTTITGYLNVTEVCAGDVSQGNAFGACAGDVG